MKGTTSSTASSPRLSSAIRPGTAFFALGLSAHTAFAAARQTFPSLSFTATAADPDGPTSGLTCTLHGAPAGAVINPSTGAFSWVPPDNGTFTFTVRVTDSGTPSQSDEEDIIVTVNNVAPTATADNSGPIDEGGQVSITVAAYVPRLDVTDPKSNWFHGVLTFSNFVPFAVTPVMLALAAHRTTRLASHGERVRHLDIKPGMEALPVAVAAALSSTVWVWACLRW